MPTANRGAFVPIVLLGAAAFSASTAAVSTIIIGAGEGVDALPAILTGTGATAAVSLAVYISKKLLSGEITPLPITTLIDKMERQIERQEQREERERADRAELRDLIKQATQAQFAIHEYLRGAPGPRALGAMPKPQQDQP